jgi:hypothetical protein
MPKNQPQSIGTPFKPIVEAAAVSGLSQSYLRKGCKAGTIPHICAGTKYLINIPALFDQLGVPYEAIRL